jgi:hypothetical protein
VSDDSAESADLAKKSRGSLTRVLLLYRAAEKLEELPAYAKAFRARQEAWEAIRADFKVFTVQSQAFFLLFDQLATVEGAAGELALKQARERYYEICRKLYRHLVEFLAGLLLMIEGTELRIRNRLEAVGFCALEPSSVALPIGPFVFLGVVMIVAILGIVAIVPQPHPGPLPLALTAMLIGTTKTIGVLAAVLPKLRWSPFRRSSEGNLPYLAWLASAGVATLVSFLIERAAIGIARHDISAALDFSHYPLTPLAPTTFAICLSIAIICDIDLHLGRGWILRITEGVLCGASMVTAVFICTHLLDIPSATEAQTSPWFPSIFAFSIGFVSGFVAPYLYRRQRGEEPQLQMVAISPI